MIRRASKLPSLKGLVLLKSDVHVDDRGWFAEAWRDDELLEEVGDPVLAETGVLQVNSVFSRAGVLRGLHYQREPAAQAKLVRCVRGQVFDVAVDLRGDSPTFSR